LPDQIDALDIARRIAVFAAAEDDARDSSVNQQRRELGVAFRRPSLGMAERRAWRDAHERPARLPSALLE